MSEQEIKKVETDDDLEDIDIDVMSIYIYLQSIGFFVGKKKVKAYIILLQVVCVTTQYAFLYWIYQQAFVENYGNMTYHV